MLKNIFFKNDKNGVKNVVGKVFRPRQRQMSEDRKIFVYSASKKLLLRNLAKKLMSFLLKISTDSTEYSREKISGSLLRKLSGKFKTIAFRCLFFLLLIEIPNVLWAQKFDPFREIGGSSSGATSSVSPSPAPTSPASTSPALTSPAPSTFNPPTSNSGSDAVSNPLSSNPPVSSATNSTTNSTVPAPVILSPNAATTGTPSVYTGSNPAPDLTNTTTNPALLRAENEPIWLSNMTNGSVLFPLVINKPGPALFLEPKTVLAMVDSEVVLAASCLSEDNIHLRMREKIEWSLDGVGYFLAVNPQSGSEWLHCDRISTKKISERYMVSSTSSQLLTIDRGTSTPLDDVSILKGQSWATVRSAQEGTTYVNALAPGILNWNSRSASAVIHWIDAAMEYPAAGVAAIGENQLLTTTVHRRSQASVPRNGWIVRYEVTSGPSAGFGDELSPFVEVVTDSQGNASALLRQKNPQEGSNQITVQVFRPEESSRVFLSGNSFDNGQITAQTTGDQTEGGQAAVVQSTSADRILVDQRTLVQTWLNRQILSVQIQGPGNLKKGSSAQYRLTVNNESAASQDGVVRLLLPSGVRLVSSSPEPNRTVDNNLIWGLNAIPAQSSIPIDLTLKIEESGNVNLACFVDRLPALSPSGNLDNVPPITTVPGNPWGNDGTGNSSNGSSNNNSGGNSNGGSAIGENPMTPRPNLNNTSVEPLPEGNNAGSGNNISAENMGNNADNFSENNAGNSGRNNADERPKIRLILANSPSSKAAVGDDLLFFFNVVNDSAVPVQGGTVYLKLSDGAVFLATDKNGNSGEIAVNNLMSFDSKFSIPASPIADPKKSQFEMPGLTFRMKKPGIQRIYVEIRMPDQNGEYNIVDAYGEFVVEVQNLPLP